MNLTHLGDALDHWKGSVIRMIRDKELQIVPMLTEASKWTPEHLKTYSVLLQVSLDDILKKGKDDLFSGGTRRTYFCGFGEADLFLDPDTGIAPSKAAGKEHINPLEIETLLSGSRMLLIYQHASRLAEGPKKKLALLRKTQGLRDCGMCAYDSGSVSMVVVSRDKERIGKARDSFSRMLGPVASKRIIE